MKSQVKLQSREGRGGERRGEVTKQDYIRICENGELTHDMLYALVDERDSALRALRVAIHEQSVQFKLRKEAEAKLEPTSCECCNGTGREKYGEGTRTCYVCEGTGIQPKMSNVVSLDLYREYAKLEVWLQEFRDFAHRHRSGDTAMLYHVERLEKAVEGLKKALFEFEGTLLVSQLEASVKQQQGGNQ